MDIRELILLRIRFFDNSGNIKPNSVDKSSENPNTFNAYFHNLVILNKIEIPQEVLSEFDQILRNKYVTNGGILKTNEFDTSTKGNFFSLDESIGYAASCRLLDLPYHLKKLKIWTAQTWFRPDVVASLYMYKYPFTRYIFLFQIPVIIGAILSCMREEGETSGKCLAFLELKTHKLTCTFKFCEWLLRNKGGFLKAHQIYFPEYQHIINFLMRRYYGLE